jgi:hypothetical protein
LYSSSLRLFTTYAIFFYSPLLSPPFHFPVSEKLWDGYCINPLDLCSSLYIQHYGTWTIKINFP